MPSCPTDLTIDQIRTIAKLNPGQTQETAEHNPIFHNLEINGTMYRVTPSAVSMARTLIDKIDNNI